MSITIKDIARIAKVSITTVSRVINNKPDVSADTREKIHKIINDYGYNPNGIARGLVLRKTYTIGLIIPDISNPFFPDMAKGVEKYSRDKGYSVIFCNTNNDKDEESKAIELLNAKQVDGLLVSLSIKNKIELKKLEEINFPVVQIDRSIPGVSYPMVLIDNLLSAYTATNHLIKLNHLKIAHITGDLGTKSGQDRLKGFKKALNDGGVELESEWIIEGDYSKKSGYVQMKKLLIHKKRPTAIFVANDLMAVGAYEAMFDMGLKIPEDISIIGHDDIELTSFIRPTLTTMSQPKYSIGQTAAEMLITNIENNSFDNNNDIILQTELITRNSTRKL